MISLSGSDMPGKSNSFFKIILTDVGSHNKLLFPKKFVTIFGKNLKDSVSLTTPSGSQWLVELKRHKGEVWLQNGWPEFAKFYSICFGYLLVFKYNGDSNFRVSIFEPSALEIDYPVNFVKSTPEKKRVLEIDDFSSSESSDNVLRPCKKTRTKAPSSKASSKPRQEKEKTGNEVAKYRALALANAFQSKNPFFIHVMKESHLVGGGWPNVVIIHRAANDANDAEIEKLPRSEVDKARVLESVKAFKPKHPNFTVEVKYSYLYGGSITVPVDFISRHITKDSCKVNLKLPDGEVWKVKCYINKKCAKFSAGWKNFAKENNLAVGDICGFELVKERLFRVVIFRVKSGVKL
ncbi:B3 domain-containing transcription factor VRN1-like isoform X3 [Apium graveolens]|uniref:B3 domain-containing transcription factor VRN1-like isoform X3 n=1 Tax=Apium graveolens TaxID=4045 RepID=UPI003D791E46